MSYPLPLQQELPGQRTSLSEAWKAPWPAYDDANLYGVGFPSNRGLRFRETQVYGQRLKGLNSAPRLRRPSQRPNPTPCAAYSGLFARRREISVGTGLRGGAERDSNCVPSTQPLSNRSPGSDPPLQPVRNITACQPRRLQWVMLMNPSFSNAPISNLLEATRSTELRLARNHVVLSFCVGAPPMASLKLYR